MAHVRLAQNDSDEDEELGLHDVDLEDSHAFVQPLNTEVAERDDRRPRHATPDSRRPYRTRVPESIRRDAGIGPDISFPEIFHKVKNIFLMIPAFFIGGVILFVTICTTALAIPWRYQQELRSTGFPMFTVVLAVIFVWVSLMTLTSFVRCVLRSSSVRVNPPTLSRHMVSPTTCRTCHKCQQLKPERSHHCSICGECVLKMDHHCPWVSNCVGYYNYKYFCLFVWYATMGCHLSTLICLSDLYLQLTGKMSSGSNVSRYTGPHSGWMMVNSLLTLAFGITLTCFSFFHATLVCQGTTTIEFAMERKYNLGWKANFCNVFGSKPLLWFLPVETASGDGYEFCGGVDNHQFLHSTTGAHSSDNFDIEQESDPSPSDID